MPTELHYDLSQYTLRDFEHASGCPADPLRQEAEVVQLPDVTGLVQQGTTDAGEPVYVEGQVSGPKKVKVRCCDCGAQRLFDVDAENLAALATEVTDGEE